MRKFNIRWWETEESREARYQAAFRPVPDGWGLSVRTIKFTAEPAWDLTKSMYPPLYCPVDL